MQKQNAFMQKTVPAPTLLFSCLEYLRHDLFMTSTEKHINVALFHTDTCACMQNYCKLALELSFGTFFSASAFKIRSSEQWYDNNAFKQD